jgi:signal transduction histidine kinase
MQELAIQAHDTSELAAAFLQAAITFGLVAVCGYMYVRYRKPYFALWALAWWLYSLRLGAIISFLATEEWGWLYWHQVTTGWTALALLWSALVFAQQLRWRHRYWTLLLFPPLWSYVAIYRLDNFLLAAGPAVAFLSLATLWTGVILWRHHRAVGSAPAALMAWAFFLWSLHHLNYPFLRARGAWNPWGYYLDIAFELAIGTGILLLVLEDQHRGIGVLSALSGDLQGVGREEDVQDALLARPLTLPAVQGSAMYQFTTGTIVRGVGACSSWTGAPPTGAAEIAIARVLETGEPEVIRGWVGDETGEAASDRAREHAYTAALPIFRGDEIKGVLIVVGSARDPLTVLDTRFLLALGHQVGAALANADLYRRLEERKDELQRLASRMVEQHEEERRRLSRELHDESAQVFAAVMLQLGLLRETLPDGQVPALDRAVELVGSGVRTIRNVARDLRPSLLDDLGLVPALRALADEFQRQTGIEAHLVADDPIPELSEEAELALFRSMQEGISNVARHSGAESVTVTLGTASGSVGLRVRDDGRGLGRPEPEPSGQLHSGTGLVGMRERVVALGGTVRMESPADGGAELEVTLPTSSGGTSRSKAPGREAEEEEDE